MMRQKLRKKYFSLFIFHLALILMFTLGANADYSRSGGVVTDSMTSLKWQDDYNDNGGDIKNTYWSNAISYCETLVLGGHTDWRLPNRNELLSIVDFSRAYPAIDSIFQNTTIDAYWTSTTDVSLSFYAIVVDFSKGKISSNRKHDFHDTDLDVRCVR